jgi:hypothetical protein
MEIGRAARLAVACIVGACSAAVFAQNAVGPAQQRDMPAVPAAGSVDAGPLASDAQGRAILQQLEAKWGPVWRDLQGWTADSFRQFHEGYKNYPVRVLEQALRATTLEQVDQIFRDYAAASTQVTLEKTFSLRQTTVADTTPEMIEIRKAAQKALGDTFRDLVFVPTRPCGVWDTRFASGPPFGPAIGDGQTRSFYSHWTGVGTDFSSYGGQTGCAENNENFLGAHPYAVVMTVYTSNATANGWLTLYAHGSGDVSNSTISVYYAPGPTRSQTVFTKSTRFSGNASDYAYDVDATSRFGTVDASASVVGYFINPGTTPLDCADVEVQATANANIDTPVFYPACAGGYTRTGGYCNGHGASAGSGAIETGPTYCMFRNVDASAYAVKAVTRCCRIAGH